MILHACKRGLVNKASGLGLTRLLGLHRRGPLVLYWHGVEEQISNPNVQALHTPLHAFEKQVQYLRSAFEIVSLDYLYDCLVNHHRLDPAQIAITLDDGYRNNLKMVAPILSAYSLPFAVFVCSNLTNERRRLPAYYLRAAIWAANKQKLRVPCLQTEFGLLNETERRTAFEVIGNTLRSAPLESVLEIVSNLQEQIAPDRWLELNDVFSSDELLTWEETKELHSRGATIASHSHDHCVLHDRQTGTNILTQLTVSQEMIEQHIGPCKYFAFPHGTMRDIGDAAYQSLKRSAYLMAFAGIGGPLARTIDRYLTPRLGVPDQLDEFLYAMNTVHLKAGRYRAWANGYANENPRG